MVLKVQLPKDIEKVKEAAMYFKGGDVCLCGSVADFFLLKQSSVEVKDIDFVVNDLSKVQYNPLIFHRSIKNNFYELFIYTRKINRYAVEVFQDSAFNKNKQSFIIPDIGLRCETALNRFNFIYKLLNKPGRKLKEPLKLQELLNQYSSVYGFVLS